MPANPIPVRRVLLLAAPPGTTPVTGDLRRAMAASYYRGAGPNGTRASRMTPGGGAPRVTTGAWQPSLIIHSRGPTMTAGTTRYGPGLSGLGGPLLAYFKKPTPGQMWSIGTNDPRFSGKKFVNVTFDSGGDPGTRFTDWNFNDEVAWFGPASNPGRIIIEYAAAGSTPTAAPPAPAAPTENADAVALLTTATNTIRSFVDQLYNGQIDPSSAVPGGADTLSRPSNVSDATWSAYTFQRDRIAGARTAGQMAWAVLHPVTTPQTTPGAPATTAEPVAGSNSSITAGVEPSPISTPGAGYDIYGSDGGEQVIGTGPQGGTTIVRRGGAATQTPVPAQRKSNVGVAVGVAAVAAIGLYVMRSKRKQHALPA